MAKQTVTIDDLDQTPGAREVHFSLDNYEYIVDLNEKNFEELKAVLAKYIEVATPLGKVYRAAPQRPTARRRAAAEGPSTAEMREWAKKNGHEVSDRGRLQQEVIDAYLAAH
ncbi:MAG TPA: Lsr2 family protein [Actinospica sp.]|jgi:hypothetical protein|nr:Lsr2 family protein [Actinospica sp.]